MKLDNDEITKDLGLFVYQLLYSIEPEKIDLSKMFVMLREKVRILEIIFSRPDRYEEFLDLLLKVIDENDDKLNPVLAFTFIQKLEVQEMLSLRVPFLARLVWDISIQTMKQEIKV